ncbi:transglycosylase domain-containing protein [Pelotomaculum propionicicum]|uniref:Penicillin-binding protein 1A n=1 Tax=Pelotomaculum propionicicum TaxID=258475 RepID=A0A4Y7RLY4_9FIRM|nr:penicillin-binding protein 1A [Pelotomaculum propionicicum]TEB09883.1 Penicillin-binding protein 2D [Pelotomaculum propionicicum]
MSHPKKVLTILFLSLAVLCTGCSANPQLNLEIPVSSKILDVNGDLITVISEENRIPVPLESVSPYLQKAIIAIEDARFYSHHGIDPIGIGRAVYHNIKAGAVVEGGSTITQQLAKNLYLDPRRTLGRKLEELAITIQLERKYTKNEILSMYLNQIYFGQGAYGIEAAAKTYFNKSARDLDLAESAMLAGVPRAPSVYNPSTDFKAAKSRQAAVLDRMVELGMLQEEQAAKAKNEYLQPAKTSVTFKKAPYFTGEIINYFKQNYPDGLELLYSGGLTIYTTLDINMQDAAEKVLKESLAGSDPQLNGALVAIEPKTGQVRAMVGGKDYNASQFNRALARVQPGSTFKAFVYTAAIEHGYTPASMLSCEPVSYPLTGGEVYQPKDFQGGYHNRQFTLKEALYTSDNVVAVRLNERVGPSLAAAYARRMGIDSEIKPVLSLPLGTSEVTPLELASAYGCLANSGIKSKPYFITKVTDNYGRVLDAQRPELEQAVDEKTAYIMTDMLSGVIKQGGTASNIAGMIQRPAAGKTGTTENYKDAWFVGYTPDLAAAVYIGFDDKNKSTGRTGSQIAAPAWASFIKEALKDVPPRDYPVPAGVVRTKICLDDGLLAGGLNTKAVEAAFVQGTEPTQLCSGAGSGIIIDKSEVPAQRLPGQRKYFFDRDRILPDLKRLMPKRKGVH